MQLMGLSILAIGVWAWTEKDTFNNLSRLTNIALDPAFVLIVTGGSVCLRLVGEVFRNLGYAMEKHDISVECCFGSLSVMFVLPVRLFDVQG